MIVEAQKQQVNWKITFFVQCFLSTDIAHTDSGTNKKYIIKVNNAKIFWALLMSLICCIPAGIPHISFLKQPEELKHEVCGAPHFAYQQSSCWQMLDLIKTAAPRQDREGSPPGQDQSRDNLPGNEKSTIVCRKYQNHHNHLSHCDLYLCSSSPWMSAGTFTTFSLFRPRGSRRALPFGSAAATYSCIWADCLKHRASYYHIWRKGCLNQDTVDSFYTFVRKCSTGWHEVRLISLWHHKLPVSESD